VPYSFTYAPPSRAFASCLPPCSCSDFALPCYFYPSNRVLPFDSIQSLYSHFAAYVDCCTCIHPCSNPPSNLYWKEMRHVSFFVQKSLLSVEGINLCLVIVIRFPANHHRHHPSSFLPLSILLRVASHRSTRPGFLILVDPRTDPIDTIRSRFC
jgi:hypothetical protein